MREVLYIKVGQNTEVDKQDVCIGDVAQMECTNTDVLDKVKSLGFVKIQDDKHKRQVFPILTIIEIIHKEYPDLEIENLGDADFIITYRAKKKHSKAAVVLKIACVCVIMFCGAAFSIMAFNQDSGVVDTFKNVYELATGKVSDGFTILELMYSVGLIAGIIVFYNHFGKVNISKDPTPIEVEMRLYEQDINTTLIDNDGRKQAHSG